MKQHYLLGDVAKRLGVRPYRVGYAIAVGHVPEPKLRLGNKRVFESADIERLAAHFGVNLGGKPGSKTLMHKEGPRHE
jgi:DNA-binding transcriptional MerR regulator